MDREPELKVIRRAFAKQVMAASGVRNPRVEAAFAVVAREDFLGPGPWQIVRWGGGYRATPDPDPVYLYTDDVIGILPERNLNNGQPSLHAALIAAAAPQPGEHVVHVGAGVGYYTAILAELVGATGRVTAIEFDGELAVRATANFAQTPHVRVVHGDGTRIVFEPVDVIYVNAGATRPADTWLDRLKERGRLILPLTAAGFPNRDVRRGVVFRIERCGTEFFARRISGVAIFPCEGGRDETGEQALAVAFDKGGAERVTRLYRRADLPENRCWLRAPGWCLAYRLMHRTSYIRLARVEEAAALSDLCFRSKAVWGYDSEFMALMPAALEVAGEDITAGDVWIATGADGQIAGVVALASSHAPGTLDLNKLFVEPRHIRGGVGRALLAHAVAEARQRGAERLTILADPNAVGFYERNGAVRIGEAPSDAVPGRLLPLYELRLYPAG